MSGTATKPPARRPTGRPRPGRTTGTGQTPIGALRPSQAASRRRERTRRDGTAAVASGVRHQVTPAKSPAGRGSAVGQAPPANPEQRRPGPEPRRHTAHPPASSTPGLRPPAPGPARAPSSRLGNPRNTPGAGDVHPCRARPQRRLHAALRDGSTPAAPSGTLGPRSAPYGTPGVPRNRKRLPVRIVAAGAGPASFKGHNRPCGLTNPPPSRDSIPGHPRARAPALNAEHWQRTGKM